MKKRSVNPTWFALGAIALVGALVKARSRIELSQAKHRSLAGHGRMARWFASLVPFYEFAEAEFFKSDDAPNNVAMARRDGFMRLAELYRKRFAATRLLSDEACRSMSDLQFTDAYRVPFQYRKMVSQYLRAGSFLKSSEGVTLTDLDGNRFYDLAGSYGVNLFGYDFYKSCMEKGYQSVRDLGPVLGSYHP